MQTITVERCAIVKNIPLFYFDWRIKRLNYFVVFCWNCEEFYKFRLHFFDYDAKSVLFLKGKGIVFEYERLRSTANERKPSTLPIRVVHQRMAQTTEDRAAINDRWRQLSRRIVQRARAWVSLDYRAECIYHSNSVYSKSIKGFRALPRPHNPSMTLPRKPTVSAFQPLPCFPSFFENNKFQEREAG